MPALHLLDSPFWPVRRGKTKKTVDGAPLDDKTGHVTIGFNICNKSVIDPLMERIIFNEHDYGPNLQSGKKCIPIVVIFARDDKKTYNDYLRSIFEHVHVLRTEGVPELGWLSFEFPEPQDMKSIQLCLNRGGVCKGTYYVYHICQLHSHTV
jgi:hypothetical protein